MSQSRLTSQSSRLLLVFCINMPREQLVPWQPGKEQVFHAKQQKSTNEKKPLPAFVSVFLEHTVMHTIPVTSLRWWQIKATLVEGSNLSENVKEFSVPWLIMTVKISQDHCYQTCSGMNFQSALKWHSISHHWEDRSAFKLCVRVCICVYLCKCLLCTWVHTFLSGWSWVFP